MTFPIGLKVFFIAAALMVCIPMPWANGAENPAGLELITSNPGLQKGFSWAKAKALSYVQTGKSGPVNRHERSPGTGPVPYMPCYWAGYAFRTAFYSRDYCHQAAGAHLLGLHRENLEMLRAFARTSTAGRKWFPLWAINFDGSPYTLDWQSDDSFVREVPAVFELVEQCHRQYLWTGDAAYLEDLVLRDFRSRAVTAFIELHDARIPNGVAEGTGTGDIFKGTATYNEIRAPLIEAGDGIGSQYQALLAHALLLGAAGDAPEAARLTVRAERLKEFFNRTWGVKPGVENYVRGYDVRGEALTDFGLENSWFMPMKFITEPSAKTEAYLDFISRSVEAPELRPKNVEAASYLPGVFFPYNRKEEGWRWLRYIMEHKDRDYPEISFTVISHIVEGLLGFEPNAPMRSFLSIPRLPREIDDLEVRFIPLGTDRVHLAHRGNSRSTATHVAGENILKWQACFYGAHQHLRVDGVRTPARPLKRVGVEAAMVEVELRPGRSVTVEALE